MSMTAVEKLISVSNINVCATAAEHFCSVVLGTGTINYIVQGIFKGETQKIDMLEGQLQNISLMSGEIQKIKNLGGDVQKIKPLTGEIKKLDNLNGEIKCP